MPKAKLLLDRKRYHSDGAISQLRLWLVPDRPVLGSEHLFKYSLFYGYPGRRAVAYDNEAGKGDHRHLDGQEMPYAFEGLDKLIADFEADVAALRAQEGQDE